MYDFASLFKEYLIVWTAQRVASHLPLMQIESASAGKTAIAMLSISDFSHPDVATSLSPPYLTISGSLGLQWDGRGKKNVEGGLNLENTLHVRGSTSTG